MTPNMLRHSTGAIYFSLLGVLATVDSMCIHLEELHSKLQYRQRVRYMKDNFPINYSVNVHYEDIYRTINVTRMQNRSFTEIDLKLLWVYINSQVLETVLEVLPKKHPSRTYVEGISTLFSYLRMDVEEMVENIEDERVEEILYHISDMDEQNRRKSIRPKALFDNCYRVMKQLFRCHWGP
ncbi:interleukin-34 [Carcharodon carcharias]|uniref:interleukin-34 n=1 Tax=Carcharodon carcharias TaxID=13397 RepID=UPI001B7F0D15|nr:interleukin-34 [Carcharodon carcharias]XP_041048036.1 interleukin-34 [Carcharodon carcharias]